MKHGHNLISENLQAFCLGALGGFGISVKHILLDATGGMDWGFVTLLLVYGFKLIMTALTTAVSGLVSAWITNLAKNWVRYFKGKSNANRKKNPKKDVDKAA